MLPNQDIRDKHLRESIPNAVFYIPFGYFYTVRLGSVWKLLSWMLVYIMPTAFYAALPHTGSWGSFGLCYLLVLLAVFCLYECGYIYNDTVSIHKEAHPAIRLYPDNFAHFHKYRHLIFGVRFIYSLLALGGLWLVSGDGLAVLRVGASIGLMCVLFAIYNAWRNRYNVWLYPFLVCSRYVPFMLLNPHEPIIWWMLFLSYPLEISLERFSMPVYRWPLMRTLIPKESTKTLFRVGYYSLITVIAIPLCVSTTKIPEAILPVLMLWVYRFILLFWVKTHQPANYLNG